MTLKLPPSVKVYDTQKLFRDKYRYRIYLNKAARYRFKNWKADTKKDPLTPEQFRALPAQVKPYHQIFEILRGVDFHITLSYGGPTVLVDDPSVLEKIVGVWPNATVWRPKPGVVFQPGVVVYKRKLPYKFRVTLEFKGTEKRDYSEFVDWCENSNNQIHISSWSRKTLRKERRWRAPVVVYAKSENTLSILKLMMGGNIKKVETMEFVENN